MNKIERIISAATDLFAKRGFEKTSIQEIADSAGVAAGTIIYHFKSKNNLLFIVARQTIYELVKQTEAMLNYDMPKIEVVTSFVEIFYNYFSNNKSILALAKTTPFNVLNFENCPDADIIFLLNRYTEILKRIIKKGILLKEFNDVQVDEFSSMMLLILFSSASAAALSSKIPNLKYETLAILRSRLSVATDHTDKNTQCEGDHEKFETWN